ncbi:hypothetical protein GGF46_003392 [Coemansia sp. RSA 552]|nr:hypothetical protein GGF46_003392 [Coemansia sp. RSA 552]
MPSLFRRGVDTSVLENIFMGIFTDDAQTRQQYLSIVGLLYQTGINVALGAGAFILFVFLRPHNARVYARRYKALANDERRPPKIGRGLFAWAPILWRADEKFLLETVDVDSVFFLRFLRLGMWLMGIFGFVGMCLIVPLNFSNGNNENVTTNLKEFALQWITLYHITKLPIFWLHVACAYLFTAIFFYFIWREAKHYVQVKQSFFASPSYLRKLQSRTLMVTRVPPDMQNDSSLRSYLANHGSPTVPAQVSIARKIGALQELINDHEQAVRKLEKILCKFLVGDFQTKPRPIIKIKGQVLDAIDHYTSEIESLEATINETRSETDTFTPTSVGFVSFDTPMMAHDARRSMKRLSPVIVALSPHPNDIIWSNAQMTRAKRIGRLWSARLISVAFCFVAFWPVAALTFIGDPTNIQALWPETQNFFMKNSTMTTIWQTTFSPLVLVLYYIAIPHVFRAISRYQGIATRTAVERSVLKKMYVFYFLSNIIVFTIIGLIVRAVFRKKNAADVVSSLPSDFVQALNQKAQFWTAYVSIKGVNAMFEFAQLLSLIMIFFKRYTRRLTPRELRDLTKPPEFDYSPIYSLYLWVFTVCMLYSVYAPIALPFGFLDFVLAYWVYKYAIMYVYQTRHDTAGMMWRNTINRMVVSMITFQVYLIGCLKVRIDDFTDRPSEIKSSQPIVYTLVPLPVITAGLGIWLHLWMNPRVNYMDHSLDVESSMVRKSVSSADDSLGDRFLHPIFSQPLPTPLVDKRLRHLLPRVYRGRTSVQLSGDSMKKNFGTDAGFFAPSIANASTVFGSDTMDTESTMDERDRRDFDGAATPVPFRSAGAVAQISAAGRGGSQLARSYSVDSNMTNGDDMEMQAMGKGRQHGASGSRDHLLDNSQPTMSRSPEYLDYDGNATIVGHSHSGSPEADLIYPAAGFDNTNTHPTVRDTFDPIALYGDSRGPSRAASRTANPPGGPAYQNGVSADGTRDISMYAPGPWYENAPPVPDARTVRYAEPPSQPPQTGNAHGNQDPARSNPPDNQRNMPRWD